ncbi:MAG: SusC/RagA family TonB-linked outer membrane protein [Gemmatimonadaceae bacterium]|nr:SusC/RagA family TonB-linked outer membrane protein [Gemmatimonadaceae bacterium]
MQRYVSARRASWHLAALVAMAIATMAGPLTAQQTGRIRGRITDADDKSALPAAQVQVVGTTLGAATGATGQYVVSGVAAGTVTLRVRRIGYTSVTQQVVVPAGGEVTADIALTRAATQLAEVITTATGDVEKKSFGNVVATVNADSLLGKAPITNVNELLQARTAGLQVIQGTGQTGASSSIRIRGASSLSLTNEPLIIIDGIRFDNSPAASNFSSIRVNRLGTLNPDEIESLDVIKGPSAAALYGTAAANGVIVIRTKRGTVGAPKWTIFAEGGAVSQPASFTSNYQGWGTNLNAAGQRVGGPVQCKVFAAARKACVVDSVTSYNPWTAAETDPFQTQPRYTTGLQVSGGSDQLRYFLSGEYQNEVGPYTMPDYEINRITTLRGSRPTDREINPNELTMAAMRGNFSISIRPNLTLDVNSGYIRRDLYNAFEGTFFAGMTFQYMTGPGFKNATNGLQREFVGDVFGVEGKLRDDRFTASSALNWQPYSWLTARAVVGLDQTNSFGYRQQLRGQGPQVGVSWGPISNEGGKDYDRSNNSRYTLDVGATATKDFTNQISLRTSVGAQRFFDALYQSQGRGYGLPPGASTPNSARQRESWEFTSEEATYGAFIEEAVSWRDRLFLTGAMRTDQTSAFGREAKRTIYPRAAVSYVISDEAWFPKLPGVDRLRLRTAYGKAGVQPSTIAALQFLGAAAFPTGTSADEPGLRLASIGNQDLKPEVTTEVEGGFDVGFLDGRINVEATMFRKLSRDALYNRPLPPSYGTAIGSGSPTQWQNLAAVENRGTELTVDVAVLRSRAFSLDLHANGSLLKNKLVDAGSVPLPTTPGARNEVGYPLFGLWDRKIESFADANGDGLIGDNEIVVSSALAYKGSSLPQREAGLSTTLGFLNRALQLSVLMDYRGDFYKRWQYEEWRCQSSGNCQAVNDPKASLADQAAATAANSSSKRTVWGYYVRNDFMKLREISANYTLPANLAARWLRSRSVSINVAARNLGYPWSKYPGIDPESNNSVANTGGGNSELTAQPPLRYFISRVNIQF